MSSRNDPVTISILGKEYRINCDPGTEHELIDAAKFLDARMREVHGTGKVVGTERITVMVALNLAHELLNAISEKDSAASATNKRIRSLRERIEIALNDSMQLEL